MTSMSKNRQTDWNKVVSIFNYIAYNWQNNTGRSPLKLIKLEQFDKTRKKCKILAV